MSELRFSPWDVRSLYELQVYDCPECVFQDWSKQTFVNHAIENHPDCVQYLNNIHDGSLDNVQIPGLSRSEIKDDEDNVENDFETNVPENESSITIKVKLEDHIGFSDQNDNGKEDQSQDNTVTEFEKIDDCDNFFDEVENEPEKRITKEESESEKISSVSLTTKSFFLKCGVCYKDCSDPISLKRHTSKCTKSDNSKNTLNEKLQCDKCKDIFGSQHQLEMHIAIAHIKDCPECPQQFEMTGDLVTHLEEVHNMTEFACFSCDVIFQTPSRKKKHMQHCNEGFKCSICKMTLCGQPILKEHIKAVHKMIKDKKCHLCDKTFPAENRLKAHIKKAHLDVGKSYPCHICGKIFPHQHSVTKHIRKVHEKRFKERLFHCDKCDAVYKNSKQALDNHYRMVHAGEKLSYQCDICGKEVTSKTSLSKHIKFTHKKIKNFKCGHCPKTFAYKNSLTWHIESAHATIKSFVCSTCNISLCSQNALKTHIETVHDPDPKFTCNQCGKAFKYKYNFFEHIKVVHEGKRDFKCDTCGKEFVRLSYLQKHVESAHRNVSELMTSDDKSDSSKFEAAKSSNFGSI